MLSARQTQPLTGQRVLVTRAAAQAEPMRARLEALGATVVSLPTIAIAPADPEPLDAAIDRIASYDWVVFTSANGVGAFLDRLAARSLTPAVLSDTHVCAIGTATSRRLEEAGVGVDLIPEQFIAEAVVEALVERGIKDRAILLPQADIARTVIADGLAAAGATVDTVVAYRTLAPEGADTDAIRRSLAAVDIATFASPSAVRNLMSLVGGELPEMLIVCIGPVTARAAMELGLRVDAVAEEFSSDGLIDAVLQVADVMKQGGSR